MKKLSELIDTNYFELVVDGDDLEKEIEHIFCCDLLSIVMGKAPSDCVWVTVMNNLNTLAVASLIDVVCIVLAEGMKPDQVMINKAKQQGITVFYSEHSIFEAALFIHNFITG